jgi:lysophospholipase L1-like esterase
MRIGLETSFSAQIAHLVDRRCLFLNCGSTDREKIRVDSDREKGPPFGGGPVARKLKFPLLVVMIFVLVIAAFLVGRTSAPASAGAKATTTPTLTTFSAFYLDVGASESLGFQPTGIPGHNGQRTNTGYANDLILREALKGVALTLEQVGCPGDTVQSILDTSASDACYHAPQTQLTKAVAYLHGQSGPGLVTIDLGFNDVRTCLEDVPVNQTCLAAGIAAIQLDLPKIVSQLKAAAGPQVHFVGIEYSDPYLGFYFNGSNGPVQATATLVGMNQVDTLLGQIYAAADVDVANVPSLFQMNNNAASTLGNVGTIPINVKEACTLTWYCYSKPFGPDDHPNEAGYSLIAQAIEAVLPASW